MSYSLQYLLDNIVFLTADMGELLYRSVFSSTILANRMTILDEDDNYWDRVFVLLIDQDYMTFCNILNKQQCRTRYFTSHQMICDILNGHSERGYNHFRMMTTIFIALRDVLVGRGLIRAQGILLLMSS